ncbi:kinesin-like protein KIN-7K, chloroplastic isoform X4 [Lycium ferocissimum]|uniref:kinesin-like protein KIN-7K, chloroplastic isoform X4 n=1 Tax=Lycium ferocissimum TaxID=112874 RepID=UPI002816371E|nr:kinesin-like protein KIN-7K, chloroplastic isoform X4 [Lycium ferocissimum]
MATRQASKSQKLSSRVANSPTSSTASSSKQFPEHSIDGVSSPASSSVRSKPQQLYYSESVSAAETERPKENVTVTVRFRPLSPREIRQGEEISWYADGETIVRNEHNLPLAYAYDRVFGPTTTTRHVYDVAAQHVVGGAMEGINGTIFAYGVTSSGKTHTMHGDQRSPGIIPLAVKDAFSIIQETPSREFLLRVSYLEIYNEVVNDLLNPAGQNLRIREDTQGTFVEGIKEEVVLSPAHALSLIAAGEEHRHVGSTNFNLLSSRSHTIFTLTIESSPCGEYSEGGAVTLSQLHLIDLAGSESSKAETTGMRRKEGSYINKSLLTLGTVISKLTDGKATHIPYRDSKLTRLLQSSLSGLGRVSLICTVTPSSSNSEETHNTLKFAHRAKHIEIQAAQNKIIDEKSLIKKYQNEIRRLKEELEQLKRGIVTVPQMKDSGEDLLLLKQKLEDGQVRLQSRLEQEEEAKAALLGRIQRLTKLILVSTKTSQSTRFPHRAGPRRRHSFGEEELAYLPHRRRDLILEDENIDLYVSVDGNADTSDDTFKEEKKTRKNGLLNWFKPRRRDSGSGTLASTSDRSSGLKSTSTPSTPQAENHMESRNSHSIPTESMPSAEFLSDVRLDKEVPEDNLLDQENPLTSMKTIDQIDLLREQQKILSGEVALHTSALKRLSEEATHSPKKEQVQMEIRTLKDEIRMKNEQIDSLEKQIAESIISPFEKMENQERTVAREIEELHKKVAELVEAKEQLELRNQKLAEESTYAKGLASAAAVELKALSEEVAKLMNHNEKLAAELATQKSSSTQRKPSVAMRYGRRDAHPRRNEQNVLSADMKRELALSRERELSYEAALAERDQREAELQSKVEESKQREAYLENELANMWVLVARLKKSQGVESDLPESTISESQRIDGFEVWESLVQSRGRQ